MSPWQEACELVSAKVPRQLLLFLMIPWPLLFFQKPMVSAPVLMLHTVTVTWFEDESPVICRVLILAQSNPVYFQTLR